MTTCADCKHAGKTDSPARLLCRANPPVLVVTPTPQRDGGHLASAWPSCAPSDTCGRHQPAAVEPAPVAEPAPVVTEPAPAA